MSGRYLYETATQGRDRPVSLVNVQNMENRCATRFSLLHHDDTVTYLEEGGWPGSTGPPAAFQALNPPPM